MTHSLPLAWLSPQDTVPETLPCLSSCYRPALIHPHRGDDTPREEIGFDIYQRCISAGSPVGPRVTPPAKAPSSTKKLARGITFDRRRIPPLNGRDTPHFPCTESEFLHSRRTTPQGHKYLAHQRRTARTISCISFSLMRDSALGLPRHHG